MEKNRLIPLWFCYFAVPCSAGTFFNNSGPKPRCDPCPLGYYQDENEQADCKACPNGTFTIARGSKEPGECRGMVLCTLQMHSN